MATRFFATANADTFANPSHSVTFTWDGLGSVAFESDGGAVFLTEGGFPNPNEPYNGFEEGDQGDIPQHGNEILNFISSHPTGRIFHFEVFDDNSVDYTSSTAPVSIDLTKGTQHGGFAEGDSLGDIFEVTGSRHDDVIRGSNTSDYPPDTSRIIDGQRNFFFTINKPGENVLNGGDGNDLLEGRGGADALNGGFGFDLASYESSPAAVTVRLQGAGSDPQTALATGGDAAGDTLSSIEGLIGSRFDDRLTGNALDNLLAGGLGDDTLDGRDGTDTVDYSRDHFFDFVNGGTTDTADRVVVHLGSGDNGGTAAEFKSAHLALVQVSTDTLFRIENVIGTRGADEIVGNDVANVLDGRDGTDTLDGGFGNDVLIGGAGRDTASYVSHDSGASIVGRDAISLGLGDTDGTYTRLLFASGNIRVVGETDVLRSIENVTGSNRPEVITGNELDNTLDGRGGDDIIDGGLGNDTLIGNDGIDTASYLSHDAIPLPEGGELDAITLGLGGADGSYFRNQIVLNLFRTLETDVLRGFENATGSNKNEIITGNERDNVLDGRGGTDTIDGGLGNDVIIGGTGPDSVSYASHDSLPLLPGEINLLQLGLGDADGSYTRFEIVNGALQVVETDVLRGIENVVGGSHSEIIIGNEQNNTLAGNGGDDIIDGGLGNDVIIGGNPLGAVTSTDRVSYVSHDAVTDVFGADLIALGQNGADGSYTRLGQTGVAETDVLRGIENVTGSNRTEVIIGNEQDNTLDGRGGNDHLVGGAGDDTVNGGADGDVYDFTGVNLGSDRFFDESGADAVIVNSFSDILADGTGRDGNDLVIHLTTGTFRIVDHFNGHQIETILASDTGQSMVLANGLIGGNGNGIIAGTHKGETLDGRGGDDFLFGGDGKDRLIGGDGNDRLTGGHGPDTFVFGPGFGHDVVTDYSHADHIEFDGGVFHNLHQVQAASQQVGNDTVITLDANNSITLLGVNLHSLHSDDFTFV
jgi:Ca2+-binding RTX toxin-like protein